MEWYVQNWKKVEKDKKKNKNKEQDVKMNSIFSHAILHNGKKIMLFWANKIKQVLLEDLSYNTNAS